MSRLLFAAARGARIQYEHIEGAGDWTQAGYVNLVPEQGIVRRIHPDDVHLQYGPISTALREAAGNKYDLKSSVFSKMAMQACFATGYDWTWMHDWERGKDKMTRSLFLLILAEALADKGM
jgi:hypothetical protein